MLGRARRVAFEDPSPASPARRFNLGDAMILTAVAAWICASASGPLAQVAEATAKIPPYARSVWYIAWWWDGILLRVGPRSWAASGVFELLLVLVLPAAPTLLVMRLRRPRPPLRGLAGQPGFAACVAVCSALVVAAGLALYWIDLLSPPALMALPGLAVAFAWLALALAGRWRPEPGWIDPAGRGVGWLWIALTPVAIGMAA